VSVDTKDMEAVCGAQDPRVAWLVVAAGVRVLYRRAVGNGGDRSTEGVSVGSFCLLGFKIHPGPHLRRRAGVRWIERAVPNGFSLQQVTLHFTYGLIYFRSHVVT
jgi:hypothetical protein